jgi:hypothetical protein
VLPAAAVRDRDPVICDSVTAQEHARDRVACAAKRAAD